MLLTEILLGTMSVAGMAAGISALVLYRKNNGNGHPPVKPPNPWRYDPLGPPPPIPPPVQVQWPQLDTVTRKLDDVVTLLGNPPVQVQPLQQQQSMAYSELDQVVQIMQQLPQAFANAVHTYEPQEEQEQLLPSLVELNDSVKVMNASVNQALQRLDALVAAATTPEQEQEVQVKGLTDIPGQIARSLSGMIGRGGGGNPSPPPPPRRDPPPNLTAIPPGTQPSVPQIPAAYVGGSVFATAGQVSSLLVLIQYQLSPNCPGTSAEFSISAQDASVYVGAASALGGPLSDINYAYELTPGGPPRIYRSSFPGNNTPIGELQVLSPTGGYINVEVQS